ncbi:MAG: CDP-glycerol glycerophosphotransferase family protein [Proteobacteria bacterium]|nr:CDP-glycerol glycerophosphotransferase family protein [Pseudomonadota bacterium]
MSPAEDRRRAGELLAQARRLMALKRTHEAIPLLNEALQHDPASAPLRYQVGATALRHLTLCVGSAPDHAAAWSQIGACHMLGRRWDEAAKAYGRARAGSGEGSGPNWRLARALRLCGRLAEAEQAMLEVYRAANVETAAAHEHAVLRMALVQRETAAGLWGKLASMGGESLVGATARARLAMLDDGPVTAPDARRVAFHLKTAFHEAVVTPGWMACRGRHEVLVSHDAEELVAFDPQVIVACDSHLAGLKRLMPRAITVQTRHGMGSKGHAALLARSCDYLCLSHGRQEAFFTGQGIRPARGFWPISYLQLDPLLSGSLPPAQVPRQQGRPVVLFAPTIGDSVSALGMLGDDPVAALRPRPEDFTLVIKAHPETRMRHPDWWRVLCASAAAHDHVVLVEETSRDIMPHVAACDLMVTDVSSEMFFAVAIDRPLVLLSNPARHARPERFDPAGPEWRWRSIGEEVEEAAGLPGAIAAALAEPERRAKARRACREEMLGELIDGRAGERLARCIADLVPDA